MWLQYLHSFSRWRSVVSCPLCLLALFYQPCFFDDGRGPFSCASITGEVWGWQANSQVNVHDTVIPRHRKTPGVIQSHFIMQASLSPLHTVTLWSDSPQQIPLIISFSTVSPVKNALSLNSDAEQNRRRGKKTNPSRSLFGYLKEWSYLLYSRNHIVFI